jgi:aspartate/glutamate racemase
MTKQELIKAIRHNMCADRGEDLQEAYDYITEVLQSEGVSFIVTFTVLGVLLNTVANCVEKLDTEKVHA